MTALFCLPLLVSCGEQKGAPARKTTSSPIRAEFPFPDQFPVVVPVWFNGTKYRFVLDTGCAVTSFSLKHRRLLGSRTRTHQSSGSLGQTVPVDMFAIPDGASMVLGSIQIKGEVGIIDYSTLGRWLADYDGLLGMDVIGSFILQFDCDKNLLRFLDPNTPPLSDWGIPFDLQISGGTPHLEMRLTPSISERFMIDTAARHIYLAQDKFEALIRELAPTANYTKQTIDSATTNLSGVVLKRFRLGTLSYEHLPLVEYPRCFLGIGFIRMHDLVTLDYRRQKLYLKERQARQQRRH
jgi:hypothetical protein